MSSQFQTWWREQCAATEMAQAQYANTVMCPCSSCFNGQPCSSLPSKKKQAPKPKTSKKSSPLNNLRRRASIETMASDMVPLTKTDDELTPAASSVTLV